MRIDNIIKIATGNRLYRSGNMGWTVYAIAGKFPFFHTVNLIVKLSNNNDCESWDHYKAYTFSARKKFSFNIEELKDITEEESDFIGMTIHNWEINHEI